jgi:hypothetical protein
MLSKDARIFGLNYQNSLQNAPVDERHAQEGTVIVFPRIAKEFEAGMFRGIVDGDGKYLFRYQAGEALVKRHAQRADTSRMKAKGGSQNQVGAVGLQQVSRAHIGPEPRGDQSDYIRKGIGRLAPLLGEVCDLFQSQDKTGIN